MVGRTFTEGMERVWKEMILACSQVEAKATEENCDVPQQITKSISCLLFGGLRDLSHCMRYDKDNGGGPVTNRINLSATYFYTKRM